MTYTPTPKLDAELSALAELFGHESTADYITAILEKEMQKYRSQDAELKLIPAKLRNLRYEEESSDAMVFRKRKMFDADYYDVICDGVAMAVPAADVSFYAKKEEEVPEL